MAEQNNKTRTLQDIANYTFTKGINQDASPDAQPKDTYRAALNVLKESSEGDENFLTSEYSNLDLNIKLPGKILNSNLIKQLNKWVLFLSNNEIGVFDGNLNTYTTIYKSPCLDFNNYVESVTYAKTECEDIVIVFWDGKNRVRNINITEYLKDPNTDCCINSCDELDLFKVADTCIRLNNVNFIDNAAYAIEAGMYRPFIQYEDSNGNTTNYYVINENIPLVEDNLIFSYEYIDGNEPKLLNKSIVLNFENLDVLYPYINVGFIKTVGGVSTSFLFKKKQPVTSELTVVYEGDTIFTETVDIREILVKRAFYLSAKSGLIYNNRLLLAGVNGKRNVDYQQYANDITVKYVTAKININNTKGYKNPEHVIHHKSWMRDENYMLGIVLEFEDMSESAVFPLINKQYTPFPDWNEENPQTNDTALCCTDNRVYWKEVNTAKRLSYNKFAKSLSTTDFCSGTIDNDNNTIRSEGYLGYFESEERYPIIPRCDVGPFNPITYNENNYMYPTEVIDDKLYGKPITLFKMPDSTIEPFHNNIVDDFAIEENKNRYDSKYDSLEIYPLGLNLDNVKMPTLEETGGVRVTGYRLVYVRRDAYNKSIQAKGFFVETFTNDKYGTEYIFPKHNVNSGAKWDYFSNQYNPDLTTSNTVTDFVKNCGYGEHYEKALMFYGGNTMAVQGGINMNHVKIEQQYNTTGYYLDSINGQNGFKTNAGDGVLDTSTFLDKDGRLRGAAIQIYNMYNYGYVQTDNLIIDRTNGYKNRSLFYNFKNICAENYSYVKDNVILNKILGAEYSLVNFYRESGVFILLNKPTDLSFNHNGNFFNSDTSAKKCNCTTLTTNKIFFELDVPVILSTATISSDYLTSPTTFPTALTDYPNNTEFIIINTATVSPFDVGDKYKWNSGANRLEKTEDFYNPIPVTPIPATGSATLRFKTETWVNQTFTVAATIAPWGTLVNYSNPAFPVGSVLTITNSPGGAFTNGMIFSVVSTTQIQWLAPFGISFSNGTASSNVSLTATSPSGNSEQYFFENYLDNATSNNILDNCNEGYIYYGSLKNNLPRQYGAIQDMFFIDTGLKACADQKSVTGFYGDSFINTFSFIRTGVTGMLEDSYLNDSVGARWMTKFDPTFTIQNIVANNKGYLLSLYLLQKPNVTLINSVMESDYNLDLRYEGPTFNEIYYPKLANGKYKLFSNKTREYAEDCFLNSYFYQIICAQDGDNCANYSEFVEYDDSYRNFHDNIILMNNDYNELNGLRFNIFKPIDETYKTCDCDNQYDNRIIVSTADNPSVAESGFSKFLANNFITVPAAYGNITNLLQESNIIYAHTTDSMWKIQVLESQLQANNNTIYVGTSDILSTQPLNLFISNEGYMGLQDKRFTFQNNYGYFFVDLKNQSINLLSGGKLDAISTYGMNSFFKNNFNAYYNSYSPLLPLADIDITFGFDYRHKRLLFTDRNNDYTISYYPEDKAFYSFHSYKPVAYLQNRDTFFTQNEDYELYLHEDNFNSYRKFYGVNYPSMIDAVFVYHPLIYTTLQNVGIKMDCYKNVNNQLILVDEPPTSVSVWTDRQHSGEVMLKTPINADYMENVVLNNQPHNIINGTIFCNSLMNYVVDSNLNFLVGDIFPYPNSNVSLSKDWTKIDRLENGYFNYRVNIDNKELENLKFILKFTLLNYNISMR